MRPAIVIGLGVALLWTALRTAAAPSSRPASPDNHDPGPDSKPQPGVPRGKTFTFTLDDSAIFPGTRRSVTVYVPAQYRADRPACVYVGFDGLGFEATTVFDNLIAKGDVPVLIGVGVQPGTSPPADGRDDPRFNRSVEFDGMDDALARFVVDEVFPAVQRRTTPDGLPIRLSADPNDRCVGGGSTGGIAAFTAAWERPDQFRRVFTAIGTFVCMRGGDRYPPLVRETDPKPIRVFQQDGSHDEWDGGPEVGDWWLGNQSLERALDFAGYEHAHAWGDGGHSGTQGAAVFPDAMRFLWKEWPARVEPHPARSSNVMLRWVSDPTAGWEAAGDAAGSSLVVDAGGTVRAADVTAPFVTHGGDAYSTDAAAGKAWLARPDGTRTLLDGDLRQPTGVAVSPDGKWLAVVERSSHVGYSYRVRPDGTADARQRFYWLHVPDRADDDAAGGVCFDRDGRLYVATRTGVQVLDRNGRSRATLPLPAGQPTAVCFGGPAFDTLYAASGGRLYRRRMKAVGLPPAAPPVKLPPWGAG